MQPIAEHDVVSGLAFEPDLVLRTDPDPFLSLVSGRIEATDAIEAGRLRDRGDPEALARVSDIFSPPVGARRSGTGFGAP